MSLGSATAAWAAASKQAPSGTRKAGAGAQRRMFSPQRGALPSVFTLQRAFRKEDASTSSVAATYPLPSQSPPLTAQGSLMMVSFRC